MLKHKGFSVLEVMIAVGVVAALGLGIYRLQLAGIATTQQALTRQLANRAADNLANQIYSVLVYTDKTTISRTSANFSEDVYGDHASYTTDCSTAACSAAELANYTISKWKKNLAISMNLPTGSVFAIICKDSVMGKPTTAAANCSGAGNLVIKIVWQTHNQDAEFAILGGNNFVMFRVPQR
jgi:type IV pilus modification protein PilV